MKLEIIKDFEKSHPELFFRGKEKKDCLLDISKIKIKLLDMFFQNISQCNWLEQ